MTDVQTQYATTEDGVSIAYAVIGSGAPVLYIGVGIGDLNLHHALEGRADVVDAIAASGRAAMLYDDRGSGSSDRTPLADSLEARLRDLEAVVAGEGLSSFDILAHVHGVPLAIIYAVRNPDRVRRLILSNGFARGADYYAATPYTRGLRFLAGIAADDWQFFCLTVGQWVTAFSDPEGARLVAAAMQSGTSPEAYLNNAQISGAIDVTDLLPRVTVPTLVLRDHSQAYAAALEVSKPLAARIPGARLVTVSSFEARAAAVLQFLEERDLQPLVPGPTARSEVVTVLFTDVVGHTEMMQRLGDAKGREVLREHERITREVLVKHAGTEVKTLGDGFMASFGSVTKAVECAVALQKAFDERNRGVGVEQLRDDASVSDEGVAVAQPLRASGGAPSVEPLNVRVGLNAGEPIEDGGDLFGSSVILASRIAARANGGEIFASMAVREICSGKGFLFADLGDHELRGFEDPVRVFEVKWKE